MFVSSSESSDFEFVFEVHVFINEVIQSWPMSFDRLEENKQATDQDDVMQQAIDFTIKGWPKHPKDVPSC